MHAHAPCSRLIIHGAGAQEGDRNFPIPSSSYAHAHKTPFLRHTQTLSCRFAFLGVSRRQPFTLYTMQAQCCVYAFYLLVFLKQVSMACAHLCVRSQLAMLLPAPRADERERAVVRSWKWKRHRRKQIMRERARHPLRRGIKYITPSPRAYTWRHVPAARRNPLTTALARTKASRLHFVSKPDRRISLCMWMGAAARWPINYFASSSRRLRRDINKYTPPRKGLWACCLSLGILDLFKHRSDSTSSPLKCHILFVPPAPAECWTHFMLKFLMFGSLGFIKRRCHWTLNWNLMIRVVYISILNRLNYIKWNEANEL